MVGCRCRMAVRTLQKQVTPSPLKLKDVLQPSASDSDSDLVEEREILHSWKEGHGCDGEHPDADRLLMTLLVEEQSRDDLAAREEKVKARLQEVKEREDKIELEQQRVEAERIQLAEKRKVKEEHTKIGTSAGVPELSNNAVGFAEDLLPEVGMESAAVNASTDTISCCDAAAGRCGSDASLASDMKHTSSYVDSKKLLDERLEVESRQSMQHRDSMLELATETARRHADGTPLHLHESENVEAETPEPKSGKMVLDGGKSEAECQSEVLNAAEVKAEAHAESDSASKVVLTEAVVIEKKGRYALEKEELEEQFEQRFDMDSLQLAHAPAQSSESESEAEGLLVNPSIRRRVSQLERGSVHGDSAAVARVSSNHRADEESSSMTAPNGNHDQVSEGKQSATTSCTAQPQQLVQLDEELEAEEADISCEQSMSSKFSQAERKLVAASTEKIMAHIGLSVE
eukprot:3935486-Rhodomonas_salina.1